MFRGRAPRFRRRRHAGVVAGLRRAGLRVVVAGMVLLLLWLPGLIWYAMSMPRSVPDAATHTDVVVVLTGGSERLETGLDLLRKGRADVLFVSGVHPDTGLDALLREGPELSGDLRGRVVLGHAATDTVGNAIETAVWMRNARRHSLRLVTAAYHMPRSLLEFRAALPEVRILPHPVFPAHVKQDQWWQYPGTALLFASEYTKYLVARLRLLLTDVLPNGLPGPSAPPSTAPSAAAAAPAPQS